MSTDPFVPASTSEAPRHKQSMPAGIAVPPSRPWRGGRPGEVGTKIPDGQWAGNPSPNGGFAISLVRRQQDAWTLGPHEYIGDAAAVVAEIAMKRASQFGRAPMKGDVDIAVALLGYDGTADVAFVALRSGMVHDADHHYEPRRGAVDLVPAELLRHPGAQILAQVEAWRSGVTAH
jgi:hypothetical protein